MSTLLQWWDSCDQIILRATLTVALLLVGSPMPDRSKVTMTNKKG